MASDFLDHQPQTAPHLPVPQTTHTGAISGHLPDFPLPQPEVFGSTAWFLRTGVFSPNDPQSGEFPLLPYEYEAHRGMGPGQVVPEPRPPDCQTSGFSIRTPFSYKSNNRASTEIQAGIHSI